MWMAFCAQELELRFWVSVNHWAELLKMYKIVLFLCYRDILLLHEDFPQRGQNTELATQDIKGRKLTPLRCI